VEVEDDLVVGMLMELAELGECELEDVLPELLGWMHFLGHFHLEADIVRPVLLLLRVVLQRPAHAVGVGLLVSAGDLQAHLVLHAVGVGGQDLAFALDAEVVGEDVGGSALDGVFLLSLVHQFLDEVIVFDVAADHAIDCACSDCAFVLVLVQQLEEGWTH